MNRIKAWLRGFFSLSRSETNAFIILLPLMVIIVFSEPAYRYWVSRKPLNVSQDSVKLDSLLSTFKWEQDDSSANKNTERILFHFDPNQVSRDQLMSLGFTSFLADRIVNYRNKGGKFFVKADLLKIYGMDSVLYQRLINFIDLPKQKVAQSKFETKDFKKKEIELLDLNAADTTQLEKVFGVGKKLSERIIKFRDKLGGFISANQLKEVYGLDSTVTAAIKMKFFVQDNFKPKQLNINTATEFELSIHPYISSKLAKAITAYRFQHGNFANVEDITTIHILTQSEYERVKAYLTVNPSSDF